ncbi:SpaA isopeptide-forming pilin-related protein [Bifidobacterium vansinderenii]|uniref:Uncharacterized protein n=1 Tax=Bifidobacterium vansinderenii TaxID=1984871 RepID=A0A229VXC8_9BIFI|nr:SpaA isopeptide-forming pilin-related protein [Bifidobacterium vansinderenii]OXN00284.1 hypothetical protein Tam10B_1507 [Bifidobacterium vansinderenii]
MSNNLRRIVAPTVAAFVAAAALGTGVLSANAADGGQAAAANATITLSAASGDLVGHTFDVYRVGSYTNYGNWNNDADGKIDSTDVVNANQAATDWLKAAGIKADQATGHDEAGTIAAGNAQAARSAAAALAAVKNKPQAVKSGIAVAADAKDKTTLTIGGLEEGYYLVVDSDGLPLLVGTKIGGHDLDTQTLGVAVVKSTILSVSKDGAGDSTIGATVSYTVSFKVPDKNSNPKSLSYEDVATNLSVNQDSIKVKVGDGAAAAPAQGTLTMKDANAGFTYNATGLLTDANYGKQVTITYTAVVLGEDPSNTGTVHANLDGTDHTGTTPEGPVTLANFDFKIHKTNNDGTVALKNAGFTIKASDGKYMKFAQGKWTKVDAKDDQAAVAAGAETKTNDQGFLSFAGLGDGTYTVTESTVPDGYLKTPAQFTIKIDNKAHTGVVTGTGANNGLTPNVTIKDGGQVEVHNLNSITQLPQTGAAGVYVLAGTAALLALAGGATYALKRKQQPAA